MDKSVESFGHKAEKDYSQMSQEKKNNHYFFQNFKMLLYKTSVRKVLPIL